MGKINLCIDIGNTSTKAGVFIDGQMTEYIKPFTHQHFSDIFDENVQVLVSKTGLNPELERLLSNEHYLSHESPIPLELIYDTPETLGPDRIAAAVGAYYMDANSSWLIIDIGTCITLDLLNKNRFLGGMISAGSAIRLRAIREYTAGLPLVKMDESKKFPGKSTEESIQVGVSQSIRHEIMGYINQQNQSYDSLKIVFCNENSLHFDKVVKNEIFARPNLVLEGLNYIIQNHA